MEEGCGNGRGVSGKSENGLREKGKEGREVWERERESGKMAEIKKARRRTEQVFWSKVQWVQFAIET